MNTADPDKRPASKPQLKLILILAAMLSVIIGLSALCTPFFTSLSQPENQERLRVWIEGLGFGGWVLFLSLQMLQIIIAFIPGEPVQMLAGVLYGTWGGMFTCLLGSVLASAMVFFAVRKGGERLVQRLFGRNRLKEFSFLRDSRRIELLTLILFLIPGMPKDLLTYLGGLTRIGPWKFLAIANLARVPALAASTLLGSSVSRGNLELTAVLAFGAVVIAIAGVIYRSKIMDWVHRHSKGGQEPEKNHD